ncbi:MAG: hypothetical protein JXA60_02675 [Candidatus Coatesbacteria bacterium]|nr:hypothetical protein [Candidatus Coatesbacteria bacterium]
MGRGTDGFSIQSGIENYPKCPICNETEVSGKICRKCNVSLLPLKAIFEHAQMQYNKSLESAKKSRWKEASHYLEEAYKIIGDNNEILILKGLIDYNNGDFASAKVNWKKADTLLPRDKASYLLKEYISPWEEAIELYNDALHFCKIKKYSDAIELLETIIDNLGNEKDKGYFLLGLAYAKTGKVGRSIIAFNKIKDEPELSRSRFIMDSLEMKPGKKQETGKSSFMIYGLSGILAGVIITSALLFLLPSYLQNKTREPEIVSPKVIVKEKLKDPDLNLKIYKLSNTLISLRVKMEWLQFKVFMQEQDYLSAALLTKSIREIDLSEEERIEFNRMKEEALIKAGWILLRKAEEDARGKYFESAIDNAKLSFEFSPNQYYSQRAYMLQIESLLALSRKEEALKLYQNFYNNFPRYGEIDRILQQGYNIAVELNDEKAIDDILSQLRSYAPFSGITRELNKRRDRD